MSIRRTYGGSILGWGMGSGSGCMMEHRDSWRKSHRQMLSVVDEIMVVSEVRLHRWVRCGMWVRVHMKIAWQAMWQ